jgi:hypothetical protein
MSRAWQWDWAWQRTSSRPRIATLYGLWSCAYQSGDWAAISNHWPEIRGFYDANHGEANLYGTAGAHIAMARMAHVVGDQQTETSAVALAERIFTDALDVETMVERMHRAYARHFDGFNHRGLAPGNWFFLDLTPEMGRYLRAELRDPILDRHRRLVAAFPHWWLYRPWYATGWTGHESQGLPPEILGMIFPVERWVVRASAETLAAYHPQYAACGIGDCHALESLALAISAHGDDHWVDVRMAPDPRVVTLAGQPCPELD